jgi:hypothetical protein
MGQQFKTVDRLTLDVQTSPTGLANYLKNANGELGGWGWFTPWPSTTLDGDAGLAFFNGVAQGGDFIGVDQNLGIYSEPVAVTPGEYVGGRATLAARDVATDYARINIRFYDKAGSIVSESGGPSSMTALNTPYYTTSIVVPSTATHAALAIAFNNSAAVQKRLPADRNMQVKDLMLTRSATPIPATFSFVSPTVWTNILGSTHEVSIDRDTLNTGTLSAFVYDSTLDPAIADTLRPGKAVRAFVVTTAGNGEPIFTGTISNVSVDYDLSQPKADRRAKITLTAVDDLAKLANVKRPNGVATVAELTSNFEGAGVPWVLDGATGHAYATPTVVAVNKDATLLDQVVLTRDTVQGYAWMSSYGQLVMANDGNHGPSGAWTTLDAAAYTALNVSYNTDDCINTVTVKLLRPNLSTGETVAVAYGPYTRGDSVERWGARAAEFTVQGIADTEIAVAAYAQAILDANATPKVRVNSARIAITKAADFATFSGGRKALLDLYMDAHVINAAGSIDETSFITGISHRITADNKGCKWLVDLAFSAPTSTAAPQVTPAPTGGTVIAGAAAATNPGTQVGNEVVSTDGSAQHTFTFPMAYPTPPVVIAAGGNDEDVFVLPSPTTTGFTAQFRRRDATHSLITSGTVRCYWIAHA